MGGAVAAAGTTAGGSDSGSAEASGNMGSREPFMYSVRFSVKEDGPTELSRELLPDDMMTDCADEGRVRPRLLMVEMVLRVRSV